MPRREAGNGDTHVERRLTRVEQVLPTLATKTDVKTAIDAAVAPLATKAELLAAVEPLATKEELAVDARLMRLEASRAKRR